MWLLDRAWVSEVNEHPNGHTHVNLMDTLFSYILGQVRRLVVHVTVSQRGGGLNELYTMLQVLTDPAT